jgi:hypothetical protein
MHKNNYLKYKIEKTYLKLVKKKKDFGHKSNLLLEHSILLSIDKSFNRLTRLSLSYYRVLFYLYPLNYYVITNIFIVTIIPLINKK